MPTPVIGVKVYLSQLLMEMAGKDDMQQMLKAIGALFYILIGGTDPKVIQAIVVLYLLDFAFGLSRAVLDTTRKVSSRRLFYGICKALVYTGVLILGWQLSESIPYVGPVAEKSLEFIVVITEGTSVLRNVSKFSRLIGSPIRALDRLADYLEDESDRQMGHLTSSFTIVTKENNEVITHVSATEIIKETEKEDK